MYWADRDRGPPSQHGDYVHVYGGQGEGIAWVLFRFERKCHAILYFDIDFCVVSILSGLGIRIEEFGSAYNQRSQCDIIHRCKFSDFSRTSDFFTSTTLKIIFDIHP